MWSPRANTNIQESAILFALNRVAKDKELVPRELLDQEQARRRQGQGEARYGGSVGHSGEPAREQNAAEAVNELKTQGLEFHTRDVVVQGGQRAGQRGRLHHPRRPAVPHDRRHVLLAAELPADRIRRRTTTRAGRSR